MRLFLTSWKKQKDPFLGAVDLIKQLQEQGRIPFGSSFIFPFQHEGQVFDLKFENSERKVQLRALRKRDLEDEDLNLENIRYKFALLPWDLRRAVNQVLNKVRQNESDVESLFFVDSQQEGWIIFRSDLMSLRARELALILNCKELLKSLSY